MHVGLFSSLQMHDYALNWTTHTTSYAHNICYAYSPAEYKKTVLGTQCPKFPHSFQWLDKSCSNLVTLRESKGHALTFYSNKHNTPSTYFMPPVFVHSNYTVGTSNSPHACVKRSPRLERFPYYLTVHIHTAMCRKTISFLLPAFVFCITVFLSRPKTTTDAARSSMRTFCFFFSEDYLLLGLMPSCGVLS
jgi:hypothetical protein